MDGGEMELIMQLTLGNAVRFQGFN